MILQIFKARYFNIESRQVRLQAHVFVSIFDILQNGRFFFFRKPDENEEDSFEDRVKVINEKNVCLKCP